MLKIGLDPGHGRGKNPGVKTLMGRYDPGVVDTKTGRTEADAVLDLCLTLKHMGLSQGIDFVLTHDGRQPGKGSLYERMKYLRDKKVECCIAVHANMMHSYGLFYRSPGKQSANLAQTLDNVFEYNKIWDTRQSNYGRLYIDDFVDLTGKPAILWEVEAIDKMPEPGYKGKAERIALANAMIFGIKKYFGVK